MLNKIKNLKMPHSYVIVFIIVIIAAIMANIIPAGEYDRVLNEAGRSVVLPDSFHFVDKIGCNFFDMFIAIQEGFINASQIIFFIIFAYSFVYMLIKNGTFDAVIGAMLRAVGDKISLIIPAFVFTFGILGSTMGMAEETYGLIPVFIALAVALGYDAIVGASIVYVAVSVGFSAATINPFTIGVAQGVAGVELYSGLLYRIVCFVVFEAVTFIYIWRYAKKVKADPTKSILHGTKIEVLEVGSKDELMAKPFTTTHKISAALFVATIAMLVYGTIGLGWYINEIAALFIIMYLVVGIVSKFSPDQIANFFVEAAKDMMFGALVIGLSRAIPVIFENAKIIDTIVYSLVSVLTNFSGMVSAMGMLVVQNIFNFFITSGGGLALVTMPILAPMSELLGLSRQIAILAYQFGDGFSNIFWPTSVFMMCGIMRIPVDKWYKYITPLFGLLFLCEIVLLFIAVLIGY